MRLDLLEFEPDPLTLSQRDTVAGVWATLTWSPHVNGPSPADLSQRRLIGLKRPHSSSFTIPVNSAISHIVPSLLLMSSPCHLHQWRGYKQQVDSI